MVEYKNYILKRHPGFNTYTIHNKKGSVSNMLGGTYTSPKQAMLAVDRLQSVQAEKVDNKRPVLKTKTVKTA